MDFITDFKDRFFNSKRTVALAMLTLALAAACSAPEAQATPIPPTSTPRPTATEGEFQEIIMPPLGATPTPIPSATFTPTPDRIATLESAVIGTVVVLEANNEIREILETFPQSAVASAFKIFPVDANGVYANEGGCSASMIRSEPIPDTNLARVYMLFNAHCVTNLNQTAYAAIEVSAPHRNENVYSVPREDVQTSFLPLDYSAGRDMGMMSLILPQGLVPEVSVELATSSSVVAWDEVYSVTFPPAAGNFFPMTAKYQLLDRGTIWVLGVASPGASGAGVFTKSGLLLGPMYAVNLGGEQPLVAISPVTNDDLEKLYAGLKP